MFSKSIFSERIKSLRKTNKVTQDTLAELLGVTRTQISDIENGKTTTSLERICILADYFNVSLDYLTGRSDLPDIIIKDSNGHLIVVEAMKPHERQD